MLYTVRSGDTLGGIAARQLGDARRWPELARLNQVRRPERLLVGQTLHLPVGHGAAGPQAPGPHTPALQPAPWHQQPALLPARAHLFFFMDEFNPLTKKLVRKVGLPKEPVTAEEAARILHPDRYGLRAEQPGDTKVPIGRHVMGRNDSRFISTSDLPEGSPRIQGEPFWIDVNKSRAAGVQFHDGAAIAKDLDRIAAKSKDPALKAYLEDIRQKSLVQDREVLAEGFIPPAAVKGASAMRVTEGLRVVEGVGLVLAAYDLGRATQESYRTHSVVPLAKESVHQAGGWAGAWAGAQLGGAAGAALGIETGPGALLTGAAGSLIFGTAGFFGADWATKRLFGSRH